MSFAAMGDALQQSVPDKLITFSLSILCHGNRYVQLGDGNDIWDRLKNTTLAFQFT